MYNTPSGIFNLTEMIHIMVSLIFSDTLQDAKILKTIHFTKLYTDFWLFWLLAHSQEISVCAEAVTCARGAILLVVAVAHSEQMPAIRLSNNFLIAMLLC